MVAGQLIRIESILKANQRHLRDRFQVKQLGIFGSYLRGEERPDSDLDILVEFDSPISLFDFVRLEKELSRLLGLKVDLVMKDGLKPRLKDRILTETYYIEA